MIIVPKFWMTEQEAKQYLESNIVGRLATCDREGQPYITPVNYVYYEGKIYFHCANAGHKLDNLVANAKVCFETSQVDRLVMVEKPCGCSTRYTSVVIFGTARMVEDGEKKAAVLNALMRTHAQGQVYHPIDAEMTKSCSVVEITIEKITGKKNIDAV